MIILKERRMLILLRVVLVLPRICVVSIESWLSCSVIGLMLYKILWGSSRVHRGVVGFTIVRCVLIDSNWEIILLMWLGFRGKPGGCY